MWSQMQTAKFEEYESLTPVLINRRITESTTGFAIECDFSSEQLAALIGVSRAVRAPIRDISITNRSTNNQDFLRICEAFLDLEKLTVCVQEPLSFESVSLPYLAELVLVGTGDPLHFCFSELQLESLFLRTTCC